MTSFATLTADCEAKGHPSICTEPAPGKVEEEASHSVTVTNAGGESKQLATVASANMVIPNHGHDVGFNDDGSPFCTDFTEHSIDPASQGLSSSVTVNGSPIYLQKSGVQSDPKTGDDVDILNTGVNNSLTESP